MLSHGSVPTCADCQAFLYDPDTWRRSTRAGQDVRRSPGGPLPCHKCPKSGKAGQPAPHRDMTPETWQTYLYYRRCLTDPTGLLPRDLTVVKNNAVCKLAEDELTRSQLNLLPLLALAGKRGG